MRIQGALVAVLTAALCVVPWFAPASAAPGGDRARVTHVSAEFIEAVYSGKRQRALKFGTKSAWRAAKAERRPGDTYDREPCIRPGRNNWADFWPRAAWMCPIIIDYAGVDYAGAFGTFLAKRNGRWIVRDYIRIAG